MKPETSQRVKDIAHWVLLFVVVCMSWLLAKRGAWMTDIDRRMNDRYTGSDARRDWSAADLYMRELFDRNPNVTRPSEHQWPDPEGGAK